MLYQVIGPDGKVKMYTEHARCVYPPEVERAMRAAGYKIKIKKTEADT